MNLCLKVCALLDISSPHDKYAYHTCVTGITVQGRFMVGYNNSKDALITYKQYF